MLCLDGHRIAVACFYTTPYYATARGVNAGCQERTKAIIYEERFGWVPRRDMSAIIVRKGLQSVWFDLLVST